MLHWAAARRSRNERAQLWHNISETPIEDAPLAFIDAQTASPADFQRVALHFEGAPGLAATGLRRPQSGARARTPARGLPWTTHVPAAALATPVTAAAGLC